MNLFSLIQRNNARKARETELWRSITAFEAWQTQPNEDDEYIAAYAAWCARRLQRQ